MKSAPLHDSIRGRHFAQYAYFFCRHFQWKRHGDGTVPGSETYFVHDAAGAKTLEFAMDLTIQNDPAEMKDRFFLINIAVIHRPSST
jgi:hypothetical protein